MDPRTKNLQDQIFGQWTVIKYAGIIKNNSYWKCICSCGYEKNVKAQYLINGSSKKCVECAKTKRANITGTIPHCYWRIVVSNANKRNIPMLVSLDQCYDILIKQNHKCAISGLHLYLPKNSVEYSEGKTTASLDRIDSSKPYELGNIQWLHKDVNIMKNVFDQEYFMELCKIISNHHDGQQAHIPYLSYNERLHQ